jgi:DNA-binding transcriptional ArsR family regulator
LNTDRLDATFAALADPTRRAILARLASGEASVSELAEPFAMSQPAVSKHLKVLERAGLISRSRDAQRRPRRLEVKPLTEASVWLESYRRVLEGNFQRLDALLTKLRHPEQAAEHRKPRADREPAASLIHSTREHRAGRRKKGDLRPRATEQ